MAILTGMLFQYPCAADPAPPSPDLILYNATVLTVDPTFSIAQAVAVRAGRIVAVGADRDILATAGRSTTVVDLNHKMLMPGLMDSHVHPGAAMTEFDHPIPEMESVEDVLDYVAKRAKELGPGKWVALRQVFITRLKEPRYPTRAELDKAAPQNPVLFATGPDASVNTLALKLSGIDRDFKVSDGEAGYFEKDPATGEPTGILRNLTRFVKYQSPEPEATESDTYRRTLELFRDYNAVGITSIADRDARPAAVKRYHAMRDANELPVRVSVSWHLDTIGPMESIFRRIDAVAIHPLRKPDPMLQVVGIKCFLDGGMLTGSAYMNQPWGVSKVYGITDPNYRGVLFIPRQRLLPIVRHVVEQGMQFTAHSVGDGAVDTLLSVYQQVDQELPGKLAPTRPCITHCNFMSDAAVQELPKLGICADIQPIWLWLDARTLLGQFGYDRLRHFQPLKTLLENNALIGGGSDHMQKIGSLRSINPYDPWLAMYVATTRNARWLDRPLHPEQAISREQVIRLYTINNARILFREHDTGSLEVGKLADMIVIDHNPINCSAEELRDMKVVATYLGGRKIFPAAGP
jgi:hypothetical protein